MNQQMKLSQLKHLMSQDNWSISQHFEIDKINEKDVIDEENEIIDSFDLDEQNFPSKFSQIDYSKIISNYFVIDNFSLNDD